jgi:protease-4
MIEFLRKLFYPITAPINFIQNHFKAMVFLLILILLFGDTNSEDLQQHNVEKISLVGPIFDVSEVIEQLDDAATNSNVKGVLFEVNSPGGAVAPSVELAYAVKRLQEVKPVVVYSGGMLASGGYYASVWADKIVANPGAMVGSIGVIMHGANLEEIMQKIGIKSQIIQAGAFKQVGTSDREWTKEERGELDKVIQDTYNMFVANVADGRDLNISNAKDFANAHIFI